ncbi:TrbI/VirB10 family protein [Phenylobacterium sp.]|uniref:TrbI/VirB10 family protein n=1 Tax=Phenylobacterium sp. TaxID=1871053 RepID=UPI002FDE1B8A
MVEKTLKASAEPASQVLARAEDALPKVRAPDSPVVFWGGIGGAVLAGLLVFNGLNASRGARAQVTPAPPPAPSTSAPAKPAPAPMPLSSPAVPPGAPVAVATPEDTYLRAPALVVDLAPTEGAAPAVAPGNPTVAAPAPSEAPGSPEERFAARTMGTTSDGARAVQMQDLSRVVPQGTLIAAVLESAINSDLPGAVRGVVSRDVRSFDGSRVLIPRGSRLVGQYKSAASVGQTRAFVVWSRIISPSGVSIDIASPAVDRLGRGGVEGKVDNHFFERFGASILLTVLNAGVTAAANSGSNNSNTTLILGGAGQAAVSTVRPADIPATLQVNQGAAIQVYVARDLDFAGVVR